MVFIVANCQLSFQSSSMLLPHSKKNRQFWEVLRKVPGNVRVSSENFLRGWGKIFAAVTFSKKTSGRVSEQVLRPQKVLGRSWGSLQLKCRERSKYRPPKRHPKEKHHELQLSLLDGEGIT